MLFVCLTYPFIHFILPYGGFQTSLDTEYLPTAEFLMQNPASTPQFINFINPLPGSTLGETTKFCAGVIPYDIGIGTERSDISREDFPGGNVWGARVIVNHMPLPRDSVEMFMHAMPIQFRGSLWAQVTICAAPPLENGLHLVEILIEDGQPIFTYTWAYRIDINFATMTEG